jgi:hypothetical protein
MKARCERSCIKDNARIYERRLPFVEEKIWSQGEKFRLPHPEFGAGAIADYPQTPKLGRYSRSTPVGGMKTRCERSFIKDKSRIYEHL